MRHRWKDGHCVKCGYPKEHQIFRRNSGLGAVMCNSTGRLRSCRICGCTDDHACQGGCHWVEKDLCSACKQSTEA
jgi:hypothetical protein